MKFDPKWLDLGDSLFEAQIDMWFRKMDSISYAASTRTEHIQTAVDTTWGWASFKDGMTAGTNGKWNVLGRKHMQIFKKPLSVPSPTLKEKIAKREILLAKQALLTEKKKCLENWALTMYGPGPSSSAPASAPAPVYGVAFLQGAEDEVQSVLHALLADARKKTGTRIKEKWMETWTGADADRSVTWDKDRYYRAINGEASFRAGIETTGEFELEWKAAKVKAKFKTTAFAGVRGKLGAKGAIGLTSGSSDASAAPTVEDLGDIGVSGEVEASIEMGVKLTAEVTVDAWECLELGAKGEAFLGAMAKGNLKVALSLQQGLNVSASVEMFAGAKLSGEGTLKGKWKGREIFSYTANGSLNAGAGLEGSFALAVPRVGNTTVSTSFGLTLGVGVSAGNKLEVSFTNLALAGDQWMREEIRNFMVPKEERYELMMGDDANKRLNTQVLGEINAMLGVVNAELREVDKIRFR